jgi:hypothetical protein
MDILLAFMQAASDKNISMVTVQTLEVRLSEMKCGALKKT